MFICNIIITNFSSVLVDYFLSLFNVLNISKYVLQFQKKGKDKLFSKLLILAAAPIQVLHFRYLQV